MNVYLDSSVYLRHLFAVKDRLDLKTSTAMATSELFPIEIHRTIDRYRLERKITDFETAVLKQEAEEFFAGIELVMLTRSIKKRAAESFPSTLGTLDGLHISTALLLREKKYPDLQLATHATQMQNCARALGFQILG